MIKQVIVMRKDLNMRKGKMVAMGAHAYLKVFLDMTVIHLVTKEGKNLGHRGTFPIISQAMYDWIKGSFAKICVSVDSEDELMTIYNNAKENEIICSLITDNGLTEFHGVPTITCAAIGPDESEKIDKITGRLKLL